MRFLSPPSSAADNADAQDSEDRAALVYVRQTPLTDILEVVSRKSGKSFVIEHGIRPDVATGQIDTGEVDYASLLVILRNNDLAAATIDDIVSIVPVNIIRQFPLPVLYEDDESIADDE